MKFSLKELLFYVFEPLDLLIRQLNGKKDYPPIYLRRRVGPLKDFEAVSREFFIYLKLWCNLKPETNILDVGCGCGNLARQFGSFFNGKGGYHGIDVDRSAIKWAHENIGSRKNNIHFSRLNTRNAYYNPKGTIIAGDSTLPFEDSSFDIIIFKSVFTHILAPECKYYISEIARLLQPAGKCLTTFFLFDDEPSLEDEINPKFRYGQGVCRYRDEHLPEAVTAFKKSYILDLLEQNGLSLSHPIYPGTWSQLSAGLSHQDIMILEKK